MAKGIYVGVNDIARKVKKIYVGIDGVARKVKKAYIGVNGIAQEFYSAETLVPFTSNIFPRSWVESSDYLSATANDKYGEWRIVAQSSYSEANRLIHAFDGNDNTYYWGDEILSSAGFEFLRIYTPNGVLISPKEIKVKHKFVGNTSYPATVVGVAPDGKSVTLGTLTPASTEYTNTFTISENNFFNQFYILLRQYSASQLTPYVYSFECVSGTLKAE